MEQGRKVARCGATDVFVWQGDITAADTEAARAHAAWDDLGDDLRESRRDH